MPQARLGAVIVLALLLSLASGCTPRKEPPAPPLTVVPITAPQRLEELWAKYMFDGITTVCNNEFEDPAQIKVKAYLVTFALQRMVKDGEAKPVSSGTSDLVQIEVPERDLLLGTIKRYFEVTPELDLERTLREGLGQEGKTIRVYTEHIAHDATNHWRITLEQVSYDTAAREYRVALKTLDRITHILLKERDDKTLYYQSVRYEYPVTNYVQLTGPYVTLKAEDFGGFEAPNLYPVSVRGTTFGDKLLRGRTGRSTLTISTRQL
ncbi:MAG: hypothetical protein AB1492_00505 [Bacillota bacterium]